MLDFIKSRRSTRKYLDRPVPRELLEQIVEAGRYAPSGGNNQTGHFLVVTDPAVLARLAEMAQEAFAGMEVTENTYRSLAFAIQAAKRGGYVFHYHAPALIIAANKKDYGNNMADTACALENMMLMANALDLGSCWINQLRWLNEDPALLAYERELGLAEDERVYGAVAVGFADTPDGLPERTPLPRTGNRVEYI
ncbi:MAG: nitroreductase family protein [Lachnospiraceae bacterium]|nr:nitroreductase family protein [Lachnospiraceae bacterium]